MAFAFRSSALMMTPRPILSFFTLFQTHSSGLRSGEYGGRKNILRRPSAFSRANSLTFLARAALELIWSRADMPVRGGLAVWRPYERLTWSAQQAMAGAAAAAAHLAGSGEITTRGTLGRYLAREPHRDVYEGDRRAWEWKQAVAELDAMISQARTDPDTARQVLVTLTAASRTFAGFYRERQYLIGLGIPDEHLPGHGALGRTDLSP